MECLEAIRGLASLSVLVGHVILAFWPAYLFRSGTPGWEQFSAWLQALSRFPGKFLWDGHLAVSIFFVLSGFVLSLTFFREGSALGSAAVRRYPRLMLPVAGSILLSFTLLACGAMHNRAAVKLMNATSGQVHLWLGSYYNFAPDWSQALREGTWGAFVGTAH